MMITGLDVITETEDVLSLSIVDPSNGYVVKDIEGLDPVKATIVTSPVGLLDGSLHQYARREERNLVIKLGLEPDYSKTDVFALRQQLYKFLSPKNHAYFSFKLDDGTAREIHGTVESFEGNRFSREPEVTISVLCPDPDFYTVNQVVYTGETVVDSTDKILHYPGSIETGFNLTLHINRSATNFTIENNSIDGWGSMEFSSKMSPGDEVDISTVPGSKGAWLNRGGEISSILYAISPNSAWPKIYPGENQFRVVNAGLPVPWTLTFTPRWGAI